MSLLTESEVAELIGITPRTLTNWRSQGRGPRWVVNPDTNRFRGYDPVAVDEWDRAGRQVDAP